jgi:hypothetical protein
MLHTQCVNVDWASLTPAPRPQSEPFRGIKRGKDKPRTRVLTLDEETPLLACPPPDGSRLAGDIYKLSKILGHSSVAVTEAHYAHLLKEDLVAASQQVRIPVAPRGEGGNVVRMSGRRGGPA